MLIPEPRWQTKQVEEVSICMEGDNGEEYEMRTDTNMQNTEQTTSDGLADPKIQHATGF